MISEAIEYIAAMLAGDGVFQKVYSQVELVTNADGKKVPAVYTANGKYAPVTISPHDGTAYIRKAGSVTIQKDSTESYIGCTDRMQATIPLRIVCFKNKTRLIADCKYSEDKLAEHVWKLLTATTNGLRHATNSAAASIDVTTLDMDSASVWNEETDEVEQADVNYHIACVALTIDVKITAEPRCLIGMCETT